MQTLEGHEGAVLCLAALPGPGARLLSGSGDRTIRLWADGKCAGIFTGHNDTVRCRSPARCPLKWPVPGLLTAASKHHSIVQCCLIRLHKMHNISTSTPAASFERTKVLAFSWSHLHLLHVADQEPDLYYTRMPLLPQMGPTAPSNDKAMQSQNHLSKS